MSAIDSARWSSTWVRRVPPCIPNGLHRRCHRTSVGAAMATRHTSANECRLPATIVVTGLPVPSAAGGQTDVSSQPRTE